MLVKDFIEVRSSERDKLKSYLKTERFKYKKQARNVNVAISIYQLQAKHLFKKSLNIR
jgi:hypothetical protein